MFIGGIAFAIVLIFIVALYNNLIRKKNMAENAFASVDVMLQKRADLIPQLVNTVKGYMKHERETLEELTKLRKQVTTETLDEESRVSKENQITNLFDEVMIHVEDYPDLKASENMMMLQRSINEMEEQLSAARRAFNAAINALNNAIETFPSNLMANAMGLKRRSLFEIPKQTRSEYDRRPDIKA